MNAKAENTPPCLRSITPHLICAGASDAIEFYKKAFGAQEMMRLPGPDGKLMHASVRIGDSIVMLSMKCRNGARSVRRR